MSNTTANQTMIQDVTRSVDQLCTQLSMSNIVVPRINAYNDVFEFISEFELVTATLPEEHRFKLLVKAFPPGRLLAWFEGSLKPEIEKSVPWTTIKNKIIERYSDTEDRDRHFKRLQEMRFNPKGTQKLYDYVEDLCYSLNKAMPTGIDDETKIKYIKANLPSEVKPTLSLVNDYNFPKDMDEFMRGIRQHDILKPSYSSEAQGEKVNTSELVSVLKDLVKGVKQEGEATRNVVAALQAKPRDPSPQRQRQPVQFQRGESPPRPSYHMNRERSVSPYNRPPQQSNSQYYRPSVNQQSNNHYNQQPYLNQYQNSNNLIPKYQNSSANVSNYNQYQRNRSPSPGHQYRESIPMQNDHAIGNQPPKINSSNPAIFSEDLYFKKFGVPPKPCPNCQYSHWARHCQDNLN